MILFFFSSLLQKKSTEGRSWRRVSVRKASVARKPPACLTQITRIPAFAHMTSRRPQKIGDVLELQVAIVFLHLLTYFYSDGFINLKYEYNWRVGRTLNTLINTGRMGLDWM